MSALLLCSPIIQLYLLALAAGLILAFWPDGSGPRGKAATSRAKAADQSPRREGGGPTRAVQSLSVVTGGHVLLAIGELEAVWAAEYATRFGLAIRRIRNY
jgi:hypothetical protein